MKNKKTKIWGVIIIALIGLLLLWLVWSFYDAQLNEINNAIEHLNEN